MTNVMINKKKIQPKIGFDATIKDLKNIISEDFSKEGHIVTSIILDEAQYYFENSDLDRMKVKHYSSIDFILKSDLNVAFESVDSCRTFLDLIIKKIHVILSDYSSHDLDSANRQFLELVENMDIFVQLITSISQTLDFHFGERYSLDKTTMVLETSLLEIIRSLLSAKEKNDIVILCDVLEHQLSVNLTNWQKTGLLKFQQFRGIKSKEREAQNSS